MKFKQAMIAWDPGGEIKVVPWPDRARLARHLSRTCGACFLDTSNLTPTEALAKIFIDFATIVVRDGVDPTEAHRAFLAIDEYREHCAVDAPGDDPASA